MSYSVPTTMFINKNFHENLSDLAKTIQCQSISQFSNHEKRYSKEDTYRKWIEIIISNASGKITQFIKLLKQLLLLSGIDKETVKAQTLQQLMLYIGFFTDSCSVSYKMQNQYLTLTKILKNLKQFQSFAWNQYQFQSKDQFRQINKDCLDLIKYFSSLKFKQNPSIKNIESDQKGSIKIIFDFLQKLQKNGYFSVLQKQISKIKDEKVRGFLQEFAQYYENYCLNIIRKDTKFYLFLQQLQKDQWSQTEIERTFKRLDKHVQTTFMKLKDIYIKLRSKDRAPQRDNIQKVRQLHELISKKDLQLKQLRMKLNEGNKEVKKDKIFGTTLGSPSKKQSSDIQLLIDQKKTLEAQNSLMRQQNGYLKKQNEELKRRLNKNNYPQNMMKNNYQSPIKHQSSQQRVIRAKNLPQQKKSQKQSQEMKNLYSKLSQYQTSQKNLQKQITKLKNIYQSKLDQIYNLNSQLATDQQNIQKHKKEKEELQQLLKKSQTRQKIPQSRNKELDQVSQKLKTSENKNNQYLGQITFLEQKLKRQQQTSAQQIDRINNEWQKKVSFQQELQNTGNKRDVLISSKSRLIQKLSSQLNELQQQLAATKQTEGRLREQILYYSQQLSDNQKKIQLLNNQLRSSQLLQENYKNEGDNKQQQIIYEQKLKKLIQLNKKSLIEKQQSILQLLTRINQLEAQNDELKANKSRDYNSARR